MKNNSLISKLNPAADKKYLILLTGFACCGAGVMLMIFAVSWLNNYQGRGVVIF